MGHFLHEFFGPLDFLRSAVLQRERPSLIVLDPPRSGLGAEVCALLTRVAAPSLVYVSCSPQALARDAIGNAPITQHLEHLVAADVVAEIAPEGHVFAAPAGDCR